MLIVRPIYGNGWTDGVSEVEPPSRFEVVDEISDSKSITGQVKSGPEGIMGANFSASLRYAEDKNLYNCSLMLHDGRRISGYCEIHELNEDV